MINLFSQSRRIKKYGITLFCIIGVIYATLLLVQSGISIRLISPLALIILGTGLSYLIASFNAVIQHQKLLHTLYNEVNPSKFIDMYQSLLNEKNIPPFHAVTVKAHLANAYANEGHIEKAVSLISDTKLPEGRGTSNAKALILGNLCSYYLLNENTEQASATLNQLNTIIKETKSSNRPISESYVHNASLQRIHLDFLLGKTVDEAPLYKELETSANALHRANIRFLLGRISLVNGFRESAEYLLKEAASYGNAIVASRKAAEMLESLQNN